MARTIKNSIVVRANLKTAVVARCKGLSIPMTTLSTDILGKGANYMSNRLASVPPKMEEDVYYKLCRWLKVNPETYMASTYEDINEEESVPTSNNEDVVTGITGIYNKLNELLSEQKKTNILLQEMVRSYKEDSLGRKNQLTSALGTGATLEKIAEDIHFTREKTAAIFTEVKYNREG